MVTLDNLFIVTCPVCVQEGSYGKGQRRRYRD